MKMSKRIIMSLIISTLFVTPNVFAQPFQDKGDFSRREKHHGQKGPGMGDKLMLEVIKELGLTEQQEEQLKTLRNETKNKQKEYRRSMKAKHLEVRNELNKAISDTKKLDALVDELTAIHKAMIELRIEGVLQMKRVLTQEQFEQLNRKIEIKEEVFKELRKMRQERRKYNEE